MYSYNFMLDLFNAGENDNNLFSDNNNDSISEEKINNKNEENIKIEDGSEENLSDVEISDFDEKNIIKSNQIIAKNDPNDKWPKDKTAKAIFAKIKKGESVNTLEFYNLLLSNHDYGKKFAEWVRTNNCVLICTRKRIIAVDTSTEKGIATFNENVRSYQLFANKKESKIKDREKILKNLNITENKPLNFEISWHGTSHYTKNLKKRLYTVF